MARGPQNNLGLPSGLKLYSPAPFSGMNLQASPLTIADSEFLWLENWLRLGDGNLRTAWDVGSPIYAVTPNSGRTIVMLFFYTISTTYYAAVFLDDGSAIQVNTVTHVLRVIGPAGTFYHGTDLPACAQWGTLYLLISNRNSNNDYWAWDGTTLYGAGTAAPDSAIITFNGTGYSSLPTVVAFGGHGTGLVVVPSINAGGVVDLQITNPGTGYEVGDVVQLQFSGGGSDTDAIVTANLTAGGVTAVNVTAPGSGYSSATIAFSGGGGTGAVGTPIIATGIASITVTTPGSGYTGATATLTGGGGTGAVLTVTVVGGEVSSIDITSPGSGYTSAPTVVISGDGTSAAATAVIQNGTITGVTITSSGTGYTSAPGVVFNGTGTGATGVAVLTGNLISTTVVDPGTNYTRAPGVTFVGGGGSGATGFASLQPTTVASVNMLNVGQNYAQPPDVSFTGGGDGANEATGNAILVNGGVGQVVITNSGSNYTTQPSVLFINQFFDQGHNIPVQDAGTGAAAEAVLAPVGLGGVTINNRGMGYTDAPAVVLAPGANNAAGATIQLMPFGLSGGAIETFQQRVWLANPAPPQFGHLPPGGNFLVTAAGSFTDAATSDGGVLFTNSDGFLQTEYRGIRQSNGYLYFFGDGSISIVSSVNTSGNPATTTFNYQNVDPQTGLSFRDSLHDFSKTILFANETGVFGLYGGTATLASAKLQDLFNNAIFPPNPSAITPVAATATIFDVKHYLLLMTVQDPDTLAYRNVMITWNEKEWVVTSQSVGLIYISTQKVNSVLTAWGTDGTSLYPLFQQPSAALVKRMDTKLYGGMSTGMVIKTLQNFYMQAQDRSVGTVGIDCDVAFVVSGVTPQPGDIDPGAAELNELENGIYDGVLLHPAAFKAPAPYWPIFGTSVPAGLPFSTIGLRMATSSPDFVIANVSLSYMDVQVLAG